MVSGLGLESESRRIAIRDMARCSSSARTRVGVIKQRACESLW